MWKNSVKQQTKESIMNKATTWCSLWIVWLCTTAFSLYTPNGTSINAAEVPEASEIYLKELEEQFKEDCPNAIIIGPATATYNCHGYAWYMIEVGINNSKPCIINYPYPYWEDESYMETNENEAEKILYGEYGEHVADIYSPGICISKFGDAPLAMHAPNEVPAEYPSNKRYFKKIPYETSSIKILLSKKTSYLKEIVFISVL